MMTSAAKKRLVVLVALLAGGGAAGIFALNKMENNLVYYWTPSELLTKAEAANNVTIRLGGMVQQGSKQWDPEALKLRFVMGETPQESGPGVVVLSEGAPPQMFREGIGCIVEGKFDGSVFHADRLMVKHGNDYRPPAGHPENTDGQKEAP